MLDSDNQRTSTRIETLTGLRFIAALLVFFHHVPWSSDFNTVCSNIASQGYIGVSFFFILSGFVISYAYSTKILNNEISAGKYILLRYVRILPLHILCTLPYLYIVFANLNPETTILRQIVKSVINLGLLQSFVPIKNCYFNLNAASWSLSNEIFFYVCFLFLVQIAGRLRLRFTLILLGFIALTASISLFNDFSANTNHWLFYINPFFRLIEFLIGMILYDYYQKGAFDKLSSWSSFSYIFVLICMYFADRVHESFRYSLYFLPCVSLLLITHLNRSKNMINGLLSHKLLVLLGNASFAFYLIHGLIIGITAKYIKSGTFIPILISFFLTTVISIILYKLVELPIEKFLKGKILNQEFKYKLNQTGHATNPE